MREKQCTSIGSKCPEFFWRNENMPGRPNFASKQSNGRVVIISELWVERWEKLFRIVRQRALQVLQRVREKRNWDGSTYGNPYPNTCSCCASQHTHRWPQTHHSEHTQAHSPLLLSQDTHMDCPTASPLLSTHTRTVLTDTCSTFQKRNTFFTDYFHIFPFFLPFPLGAPQ